MKILYDIIAVFIFLFYFPIYLFRGKFHKGFLRRLGFLPKELQLDSPIWIHAVSVGEAMAMRALLNELRQHFPRKKFVISTVTPTGNKIAQSLAGPGDFVTYLPLDFSFIVDSVIRRIVPSLFIIVETEIWPNLISSLHRKRIPVIIVNGRVSDSSFKGYACIRFLLQPLLRKVSLFCVQSQRDAERLGQLGADAGKIKVTGNMKFDITDYTDFKTDYTDYRRKLGLQSEDKLWVAGSSHPGEEEIIIAAYKELLAEFPSLKLLIAPRHPQRALEVGGLVRSAGFDSIFLSGPSRDTRYAIRSTIFILDTIGELLNYYAIADIVFVGGSLVKKGGHNILEPLALERPVIFGPHMFNFREAAELFLKNQAALQVHNKKELCENMTRLLRQPEYGKALSKRAFSLLRQNRGSSAKTLQLVAGLIP